MNIEKTLDQKSLNTEKTLDQMMELLPFIATIIEDAETKGLRDMLRPKKDVKKGSEKETEKEEKRPEYHTADLLSRLYPLMLTSHRAELYGILSILTGETIEAVKQKPFSEIKALLKGENGLKDFFDFFPFLLQMALRA